MIFVTFFFKYSHSLIIDNLTTVVLTDSLFYNLQQS